MNKMDVYLNYHTRTLFGPKTKYQPTKVGEILVLPTGFQKGDSNSNKIGVVVARKVESYPSCDTFYLVRCNKEKYEHLMIRAPWLFSDREHRVGMYYGFDEFLNNKIDEALCGNKLVNEGEFPMDNNHVRLKIFNPFGYKNCDIGEEFYVSSFDGRNLDRFVGGEIEVLKEEETER